MRASEPAIEQTAARGLIRLRGTFQQGVVRPLETALFSYWQRGWPGGDLVARRGLPRRVVDARLGAALVVEIDPRQLIRDRNAAGVGGKKNPSSAFIWDGDWDRSRGDLRFGSRYRFISDLDENRDDLTRTERFRQYRSRLAAGNPWRSRSQGLVLDSEEKILAYLHTYLGYLDHMATHGFDASLGKDELGVAVTRDGTLLKINRGLHRLAMAQRLGLPSIPVLVRAVHRQWWERVVQGARGERALARVAAALPGCLPAREPGDLDPTRGEEPFSWPAPRQQRSAQRPSPCVASYTRLDSRRLCRDATRGSGEGHQEERDRTAC
ncbi:hypothetical protein [Salinicola tamaricis]|uniref:hypothetical protein n=1 Tax=Salinicola tamaricis TaxID=1771309 RepID=UPI0013EB6F69|nr:hypothetical protein [Salinicola tamaricis]